MKNKNVWPGMSQTKFSVIQEYIRWLADRLGLRDWTFILSAAPDPNDDNLASVRAVTGQFRATISLCKDFAQRDQDEIRNTLIHELLHCSHRDMSEVVIKSLGGVLGAEAYLILLECLNQATERHVDALAGAFADMVEGGDRQFVDALSVKQRAA